MYEENEYLESKQDFVRFHKKNGSQQCHYDFVENQDFI